MSDLVILNRLLLVAVLAGFVGYERERHGRAAGLRTHILVGLGSCLVMLTALHLMQALWDQVEIDPTRMAAQVVSGIGFLGAGTILRFRASVRGLTTAASLWAVAGIGLAVGAGFMVGAVATTGIVFVVLLGLGRLERRIRRDWYRVLIVESHASSDELAQIRQVLADYDVEIRDFEIKRTPQPDYSVVEFQLRMISEQDEGSIVAALLRIEGIRQAHWA